MLIAGIGLIVILILAAMTGLTIYATYKDCDPIKLGLVDKPDQVPLQISDTRSSRRFITEAVAETTLYPLAPNVPKCISLLPG